MNWSWPDFVQNSFKIAGYIWYIAASHQSQLAYCLRFSSPTTISICCYVHRTVFKPFYIHSVSSNFCGCCLFDHLYYTPHTMIKFAACQGLPFESLTIIWCFNFLSTITMENHACSASWHNLIIFICKSDTGQTL